MLSELPPEVLAARSRRTLSAAQILDAPSFDRGERVTYYDERLRAWVTMDEADSDFWRMVDEDNAADGYYG